MTTIDRQAVRTVFLMSLVFLVSCSDDGDPARPDLQFAPTLEALWPHADGNSWAFRLTTEKCEHPDSTFYENLEDVPPIPTFAELHARLVNGIPCGTANVASGSLNLRFAGEMAVGPGDTVQVLSALVETDNEDDGWPIAPAPLYDRLWRVDEERIVGYPPWGNDDRVTWVYLVADLEPGVEFSWQLDVGRVQGRVWRYVQHRLPDRTIVNCVECLYALDLGIQKIRAESGQILGYVRLYMYWMVLYAEDVGPILCRHQFEGLSDVVLQDQPIYRYTVDSFADLTDWNVQAE